MGRFTKGCIKASCKVLWNRVRVYAVYVKMRARTAYVWCLYAYVAVPSFHLDLNPKPLLNR